MSFYNSRLFHIHLLSHIERCEKNADVECFILNSPTRRIVIGLYFVYMNTSLKLNNIFSFFF